VGQAFADGLDSGCERRIDARLPMGRESHVLERHVLDQPVGAEGREAVLGIVPVEGHTAKQLAGEVLIQAKRLWRFAVTHESFPARTWMHGPSGTTPSCASTSSRSSGERSASRPQIVRRNLPARCVFSEPR
jgi:hypothetical protein